MFIRKIYKNVIIESLQYCIDKKGLNLRAFVFMYSHVHAIVSTQPNYMLVDTIRDFKKFTSKRLIELMKTTNESRRVWLLNKFSFEANRIKRAKNYVLWQPGYHAVQIYTADVIEQKLNYIQETPVK